MCICINCIYVHKCSTYKFIAMQHCDNQYRCIKEKLFNPYNPVLNANYIEINNKIQIDWDVIECLSFIDKPGYWKRKH